MIRSESPCGVIMWTMKQVIQIALVKHLEFKTSSILTNELKRGTEIIITGNGLDIDAIPNIRFAPKGSKSTQENSFLLAEIFAELTLVKNVGAEREIGFLNKNELSLIIWVDGQKFDEIPVCILHDEHIEFHKRYLEREGIYMFDKDVYFELKTPFQGYKHEMSIKLDGTLRRPISMN